MLYAIDDEEDEDNDEGGQELLQGETLQQMQEDAQDPDAEQLPEAGGQNPFDFIQQILSQLPESQEEDDSQDMQESGQPSSFSDVDDSSADQPQQPQQQPQPPLSSNAPGQMPQPGPQTAPAGQQPGTGTSARPGSAEWYRERLLRPLCAGARVSVLVFLFILLTLKRDRGLTDSAMDIMLCLMAKAALPADNCLPPSWYLAKQVIG